MDIIQPVQAQNQQNQEPVKNAETACSGGDKKSTVIGIIALVVIAGLVAVLVLLKTGSEDLRPSEPVVRTPQTSVSQFNESAQTSGSQTEEDSTAAISQQLNDVTMTDLDSQFKDIDNDLNSL